MNSKWYFQTKSKPSKPSNIHRHLLTAPSTLPQHKYFIRQHSISWKLHLIDGMYCHYNVNLLKNYIINVQIYANCSKIKWDVSQEHLVKFTNCNNWIDHVWGTTIRVINRNSIMTLRFVLSNNLLRVNMHWGWCSTFH